MQARKEPETSTGSSARQQSGAALTSCNRLTTLVGIVAISLLSLISAQSAAPSEATGTSAEGVNTAVTQLSDVIDSFMQQSGLPGLAAAIVYRDDVVFLDGYGVRDVNTATPVTADTVFQIASLSKPVSATVMAAMISQGFISWDDRLIDLLPGFRLQDNFVTAQLTLRDMFSHRSGLDGNAGNDLELLGYGREEILSRLRYLPLTGAVRDTYAYSNFGMTAAGEAAAHAAGLPWEDAAQQFLFGPLGMDSTSANWADFMSRENRASLHVRHEGTWRPLATRNADAQSPAGGVSSTARDMAEWLRLQLAVGNYGGQKLIDQEALRETRTPHILTGNHPLEQQPVFYGLGFNIYRDTAGSTRLYHAGAFSAGAQTFAVLLPEEQLGIVVLTNAFGTGVPEALADSFIDMARGGEVSRDWLSEWGGLYEQLLDSFTGAAAAYTDPPAQAADPLPLTRYTGTYSSDYFGKLEVIETAGELVLKLGPDQQVTYPLRHWNRDHFIYFPAEELPDLPAGAAFSLGADGFAQSVELHDLNDLGQGLFVRINSLD